MTISVGLESIEKVRVGLDHALGITHNWERVQEARTTRWVRGDPLDRSVGAFRGIKELMDVVMVQEEFSSAGFVNLLGASMTRKMLQGYAAVEYGIDLLLPQSNRVAVTNLKTQERIRVGYFSDLPQVNPELIDWPELSSPTDEKATYDLGQYGGTATITRRMWLNDDLGFIGTIADRAGRAAHRTFAKRVFNLLINNAAIYDSVTWAHASLHGANLRTTALGADELDAIRTAMLNQTEKDSGEKLAIGPSILVVPIALGSTAKITNEREYTDTSFTPNKIRFMFGNQSERIIVSPLLSDVTDFYVFADQTKVPCLEAGFLFGRQDPELLLANNPLVGMEFTSDRMQYKVRHEYEVVPVDFRGFAKNAVNG
jgi:hypothetical protein